MPAIIETMLRHPEPGHRRRDPARSVAVLPRSRIAARWAAARRAAGVVDGGAADAGQRDRAQPVRAQHPLPVHGDDDRAARDRGDRGRPRVVAVQGDARRCLPIWLLGCAYMTNVAWSPSPIGDSYNVWARPDTTARRDARGAEAGARRRVGHGHVHVAAAPLAPRADLRLAEPVGALVLGQRRRVPIARPVDHRLHRPRSHAGRRGPDRRWSPG